MKHYTGFSLHCLEPQNHIIQTFPNYIGSLSSKLTLLLEDEVYGKRVWEIPHKEKKTKFNKRKKIEQNLVVEWKNQEGYQRQWSRDQRRKQI